MQAILMSVKAMKTYKKKTLFNCGILTVIIAFLLIMNSQAIMNWNATIDNRLKESGDWSYISFTGTLIQEEAFDKIGTVSMLEETESYILGSFDQPMFDMSHLNLKSGRLPKTDEEVIVTRSIAADSIEVNDVLTYSISGVSHNFTVVGIIDDYKELWVEDFDGSFKFPNVITTQHTSSKIASFGYMNKTDPNFVTKDVLNSLSYPELASENGEAYKAFLDEKQFLHDQIRAYSLTLTIVAAFLILYIVTSNSQTYEKKTKVLRTLGYTQKDEFLYHVIQYVLYTSLVLLISIVLPGIGLILFNHKFAFDSTIYIQSVLIIILLLFGIGIFKSVQIALSPLVPNIKIVTKNTNTLQNILRRASLVFIVGLMFLQIMKPMVEIVEHELAILRYNKNMIDENGYTFLVQNVLEKEFTPINMDKVDALVALDGIRDSIVLSQMTLRIKTDPLIVLDDGDLMGIYSETWGVTVIPNQYLESFPDKEFVDGKKLYMDISEFDDKSPSSVTTLNEYTLDIEYREPLGWSLPGVHFPLISENGYKQASGGNFIPNFFAFSVNRDAKDKEEIERAFYKLGQFTFASNGFQGDEMVKRKQINYLREDIFQLVLFLVVGISLLVTITLNYLNNKRRDIGTSILLGMDFKMIKKHYLRHDHIILIFSTLLMSCISYFVYSVIQYKLYFIDAKINMFEAPDTYPVYFRKFLQFSIDEKTFFLIGGIGLLFVVIMVVLNHIILKRFYKTSPFELIDERE